MLEPQSRRHLLDSLKPPSGCELTDAVGTSFSLDLMTLLTVPLAFTFFEWDGGEKDSTVDPMALLEALRRQTGRIDLFCQASRIQLPKPEQRLLNFLEHSVHESLAPADNGAFHPKTWILRFATVGSENPEIVYRFLCLSRNLTFDRSWDTCLVMEGVLKDRERAIAASRPLSEFVASLPPMSMKKVLGDASQQRIDKVSSELLRVEWTFPNGFEGFEFHPLGQSGQTWPFVQDHDRVLIISPFASDDSLTQITAEGSGHILVSRSETLAELSTKTLAQFTGGVFALMSQAEPEADGDDAVDAVAQSEILSGLHAKTYIVESGSDVFVYTGSANATNAGIGAPGEVPRNVEFLVRLQGRKKHAGIDRLMSGSEGETAFKDLLQRWAPDPEYKPDTVKKDLERRVDSAACDIAKLGLGIFVTANSDGSTYAMRIAAEDDAEAPDWTAVEIRCWPSSFKKDGSAQRWKEGEQFAFTFDRVSFEALTAFIAFNIKATKGMHSVERDFVLKLPLNGAPEDRAARMMKSLLKDKKQVLRLILFLLAESGGDPSGLGNLIDGDAGGANGAIPGLSGNVWESLLRTLDRDPTRLRHIDGLVDDLQKSPETSALLPDGFMDIWAPLWTAARETYGWTK